MQFLSCMEAEQKLHRKMPPLVPDDLHILPIIVRSEDKKLRYVSYWNPEQVSHVTVLNDQFNFEKNTIFSLPYLPKNHFQTIEKVALLLSLFESTESPQECEQLQSKQLEECFKVSKRSPRYLYQLLKTADFLNCTSVYNACRKHLNERTKNLLQNNKIKSVARLVHPRNGPLTNYLGNDILDDYGPLRNFLIRANNLSIHHHEVHDIWYTWPNQDTIMFRTKVPTAKIKCWFDRTMYEITPKSTANLHRTYICPISKRFFGLFADHTLEAHDLTTQAFLGSCKISNFSCSMYYAHALKKLFLVDNHELKQYNVTEIPERENKPLKFREEQSWIQKSSSYTSDPATGTFYFARKRNGIYHYDPSNNIITNFSHSKKNKKRTFLSMCLSRDKQILYTLAKRKTKRKYHIELCFWNTEEKKLFKVIPLQNCSADCLAISPDGSLLAVASYRKDKVHLFDAKSGAKIKTLNTCSFPVAFSQDNKVIATHHKKGFTEHTIHDAALEQQLKDYSPEHIVLLAVYAKAILLPHTAHNLINQIHQLEKKYQKKEHRSLLALLDEFPKPLKLPLKQLLSQQIH